ncbi:MAG: hypothetical protein ACXAB5_03305 [Candidatus Thorarchaeota archaeon]
MSVKALISSLFFRIQHPSVKRSGGPDEIRTRDHRSFERARKSSSHVSPDSAFQLKLVLRIKLKSYPLEDARGGLELRKETQIPFGLSGI